jgi:alpha-1,6-mannosyltransferase
MDSDRPTAGAGDTSRATRRVLLLGVASLVLQWLIGVSIRALLRNGFPDPLGPSNLASPADPRAAVWQFGLYVLATIALFWVYARLLSVAWREGLNQVSARTLALGFGCFFTVLQVFEVPRLSGDAFSYMAHGYLGQIPGSSPLLRTTGEVAATPLGPRLAEYGWTPVAGITPYGVLWTRLEMAIMHVTTDVPTALLLLKSAVVLSSLACAVCIWVFVGRTAPRSRLTATLAYLWNPLFLFEFAGEAHNDAIMVAFVLAGLVAISARRPTGAGVALMLGVLTKYVPLLLVPPQFAYLARTRKNTGRLALSLALALAVSVGIAAILYAPIWAGADSFRGIVQRAGPCSSATPLGALYWVLIRSPFHEYAGIVAVVLSAVAVCAFVLWQSTRETDLGGLARSCAWISFLYLLAAAPDYWPWYSCMPVALLIAGYQDRIAWLVVILSLCARLSAPFELLYVNGFLGLRVAKGLGTGLGATLPLALVLAWAFHGWRRVKAGGLQGA